MYSMMFMAERMLPLPKAAVRGFARRTPKLSDQFMVHTLTDPTPSGSFYHAPDPELIADADDPSLLDIHFEQIFAGTDRPDACIGPGSDHIGIASAQLGASRIGKVAVDGEGDPVRVGIAAPHLLDLLRRTHRDVDDVHEGLPAHTVGDPDFGLVRPEPNPMLVELPGNAPLSGNLGGTHNLAGGDVTDLEAVNTKEVAIEPRLGAVDRIWSTDTGKGADLLEDRLSTRLDHCDVLRALGLDVDAVSREAVQTIVRSRRHRDAGDLVTGRGICDDHTGVWECLMTRNVEFAAIGGAR